MASNGWLSRFLSRFKLIVRRVSTSGHELPENCSDIVFKYLQSVNYTIVNRGYSPSEIIHFEEISICANMLEKHSYKKPGKSKLSGDDKMRASCLVAATLDGKKLPTIIIIPDEIQSYEFLPDSEIILLCEQSGKFFKRF
jgi:hypothetical protein